ncbi:cytochrome c maturation protein CcmE [Immundisolibacter sp.]|uniref:cytochrome c maturation protein CcmE n=1 Tax=Immundisolibacter sp. TaxID=1934948 RepID=UPI002639B509|nr:cytochrome c maturation protein CcmE [Immundisolibacter sp.]MDD3651604.1 cytochrome c maturation protein CcmE [Immundisolibacter sp.]
MKTRHKRLLFISLAIVALVAAVLLVMNAFRDNLVFFFSPTEVAAGKAPTKGTFRLGGLVMTGSVQKGPGPLELRFTVTDLAKEMRVHYVGPLPDLFREGQGVVAEGRLGPDGEFQAAKVLAKHDENYMPPEVAQALEKSGAYQAGHPRAKP